MSKTTRIAKCFTIEREISDYIVNTKGERPASQRVNELLRRAMLEEQYERLEREAASFFSDIGKAERRETRALQRASLRSITRH